MPFNRQTDLWRGAAEIASQPEGRQHGQQVQEEHSGFPTCMRNPGIAAFANSSSPNNQG